MARLLASQPASTKVGLVASGVTVRVASPLVATLQRFWILTLKTAPSSVRATGNERFLPVAPGITAPFLYQVKLAGVLPVKPTVNVTV